jgi:hypothetical protein
MRNVKCMLVKDGMFPMEFPINRQSRCIIRVHLSLAIFLAFVTLAPARAQTANHSIDLSQATIISPVDVDGPEAAALRMLMDETEKRTGLKWQLRAESSSILGSDCAPCIFVGRRDQLRQTSPWPASTRKPEAFHVETLHTGSTQRVLIAGEDDRGVLFGIGYLLRHIEFSHDHAALPAPLNIFSAPQFAVRGHQLGYRFKNNTYDAWTPQRFDQYIRDLAVFGANTIELLPPITDDAPSSPLFPLPAMETMTRVSGIVKEYGLRCSVFYPAMAKDYADPNTAASELRTWGDVFSKLPQVDEVFVPGGDPGHTDPAVLFPFLAQVAEVLHHSHPQAGIWVSAQGFNADQMTRFYALVNARPAWLSGIVVGPQSRDGLETQRAHIPKEVPIRFYPDITHSMHSQFPVPEWDEAYALTEGREVINPRPMAQTAIFHHYSPYMSGFVTYSEGVNDDVNKFIWSALGWSSQASPAETLRQYARYFVGNDGFRADALARGISALEKNWTGRLPTNDGVDATLRQIEQMQKAGSPALAANWRFEEILYRAYTDAYERHRLIAETAQEHRALASLAEAGSTGSLKAMENAKRALAPDPTETEALQPWRSTIETLAGQLFQNIGLQLSVKKYGASAIGRGASLDTVDVSLNDRAWLEREFSKIRAMNEESDRLKAIAIIVHWQDPGPNGFYDDLGDPSHEPHLVRGPGYPSDPALILSAQDGIADQTPDQGWRMSQLSYAGALYDRPLELRYTGLDATANYELRIVYAGEDSTTPMTLTANDRFAIHGPRLRKSNPETVEFQVPRAATRGGTLDLKWTRPKELGGGGRGLQVAEVWLLRHAGYSGDSTPAGRH